MSLSIDLESFETKGYPWKLHHPQRSFSFRYYRQFLPIMSAVAALK